MDPCCKGPLTRYPGDFQSICLHTKCFVGVCFGGHLVDSRVLCPSSELQNLVPLWSLAELQRALPCVLRRLAKPENASNKPRYHDRVCALACGNCKPCIVPELFSTKALRHEP